MVGLGAGKGERGHGSGFPRSEQSRTPHETTSHEGHDSNEDHRCQHKKVMTESCQQPPVIQPGLEGRGNGTGEAAEGARELDLH